VSSFFLHNQTILCAGLDHTTQEPDRPFEVWFQCVDDIRTLLRQEGQKQARNIAQRERTLTTLLQQVTADLHAILTTNTDVDDPDVTLLKLEKDGINAELEIIHQRRPRGAFIRSRAPVIHEYKRPTATFCRLESTRARAGTINSLTDQGLASYQERRK
jgi:hypothetical protein